MTTVDISTPDSKGGASSTPNQCWDEVNCPAGCKCLNGTVDCSSLNLREIPRDIPKVSIVTFINQRHIIVHDYSGWRLILACMVTLSSRSQFTSRLLLSGNQIRRVGAEGLFNRLPRLRHLDLSRNQIHEIEEGAFEGASSLKEM